MTWQRKHRISSQQVQGNRGPTAASKKKATAFDLLKFYDVFKETKITHDHWEISCVTQLPVDKVVGEKIGEASIINNPVINNQ